ncbi:NAD(P)+ transhydrogenase beta chain [Ochrobactrum sp. MYb29]|nr:NAD(P)+ transhydrogenase beta chain [Ochrobactrum sp. MYb29]
MKEPSYRSTRLYLWVNAGAAWLLLFVLGVGAVFGSAQAVEYAKIAMLPLTTLIVGVLSVHRGFGSMDFWAQARAKPTETDEVGRTG